MHVEFKQAVTVEGVPYKKGQVVDAAKVPSGCLESCLRMQRCVECEAPKPPPKPVAPDPEPKAKTAAPRGKRTKPKE